MVFQHAVADSSVSWHPLAPSGTLGGAGVTGRRDWGVAGGRGDIGKLDVP